MIFVVKRLVFIPCIPPGHQYPPLRITACTRFGPPPLLPTNLSTTTGRNVRLHSSLDEPNQFLLQSLLLFCAFLALDAPQIEYDILRLAEIHLLQQIPHLDLHVFNQPPRVGNVRALIRDRGVYLALDRVKRRQ